MNPHHHTAIRSGHRNRDPLQIPVSLSFDEERTPRILEVTRDLALWLGVVSGAALAIFFVGASAGTQGRRTPTRRTGRRRPHRVSGGSARRIADRRALDAVQDERLWIPHFDLVAWSLARVRAAADAPAKLFLARLTDLDPTLLRLFGEVGASDRRAHTPACTYRGSRFPRRPGTRRVAGARRALQVAPGRPARSGRAPLCRPLDLEAHARRRIHTGRQGSVGAYQQQMVDALESAALAARVTE
ncbi:MAG: hypothetical protein U1E63_00380 [Burkholderiales bacterium]